MGPKTFHLVRGRTANGVLRKSNEGALGTSAISSKTFASGRDVSGRVLEAYFESEVKLVALLLNDRRTNTAWGSNNAPYSIPGR